MVGIVNIGFLFRDFLNNVQYSGKGSLKKNKITILLFVDSPPPPPKVWKIKVPLKMILKCQNTFWGNKFFLQFSPKNDLPTHKNLKFWSLVSVILTLEGVFRGHLTTEIGKRAFQSSPE